VLMDNFAKIAHPAFGYEQVKGIGAKVHYGYAFIHSSKINNPLNCLVFKGSLV